LDACGTATPHRTLSTFSIFMAFMFSLAVMAAVCMVDTTSTVVRWPSSIMRCSFTRMIMLSRFCSSCSSSFFFLRHCSACAAQRIAGRGARMEGPCKLAHSMRKAARPANALTVQ
jgi:hypothetical protein